MAGGKNNNFVINKPNLKKNPALILSRLYSLYLCTCSFDSCCSRPFAGLKLWLHFLNRLKYVQNAINALQNEHSLTLPGIACQLLFYAPGCPFIRTYHLLIIGVP